MQKWNVGIVRNVLEVALDLRYLIVKSRCRVSVEIRRNFILEIAKRPVVRVYDYDDRFLVLEAKRRCKFHLRAVDPRFPLSQKAFHSVSSVSARQVAFSTPSAADRKSTRLNSSHAN